MINQLAVFSGALHYEFLMQLRRRALWITFLLLSCLVVLIYSRVPGLDVELNDLVNYHSLTYDLAFWARTMNFFIPLGFGCILADRLVRDRRTKVDELFITTPGALSSRLLGKYAGSTLATLVPLFLCYLFGVGLLLYRTHNIMVLPLSLLIFATVILPGMLFVSAFSLACPLIMWVPLYQFGFIGYWFWGNSLGANNGIPTLSNTILTPDGKYIASGFYGYGGGWLAATPLTGAASMLLLLGIAALVLFVLYRILLWQQARQ